VLQQSSKRSGKIYEHGIAFSIPYVSTQFHEEKTMPKKINIFILFVAVSFLYACSQATKPSKDIRSEQTTGPVTENSSVYSGSLECLGKLITDSGQAFNKVKAAVGQIQDKTGKREGMGQPLSQSASDIALTALSRINAINLVAATNIEDLTQVNIAKKNPTQTEFVLMGNKNVGSILPSHFFLIGSVSEYNEDIRARSWGINFFRKLLDTNFSGGDKVFSIAMDFRLAGSSTGQILKDGKGRLLALSLQNSVVAKDFGGSLFRVFSEAGVGADYAVKISDPKHLAVREIVERGVLELIGRMYDVPWKQCDMVTPFEVKLGGAIAQYMTKKDQVYAQQVLEIIPTNEIAEWQTSDLQYMMLSTKTYEKEDKTPCREYYITIIRDNRKEGSKGTSCRQANGAWKDV
jgi:curli biogenesis system outer membrane secretion channel CsgG